MKRTLPQFSFKKAYPDNYDFYKKACDEKKVEIGKLLVFKTGKFMPKYIINFPTKKHWRYPSKMEYIESGLDELVKQIQELNIKSIAIPPLGGGNGKLEWNKVKMLIQKKLQPIQDCEILIFEPGYSEESKNNLSSIEESKLTAARAMILHLFYKYKALNYTLNLLVAQKLAYFLQRFGEPLRLRYEKGWYGPFAPNLNKVLQHLNRHYTKYNQNDNKPSSVIKTITNKSDKVQEYLAENITNEQQERLERVCTLIEGFETPFSLELLATVDYILQENPSYTSKDILENIHNWTNRKKELMKPYHIEVATKRLKDHQLIN